MLSSDLSEDRAGQRAGRHGTLQQNPGAPDLLIATHALSVGAVLVTNDRASRQVGNLDVEDWMG
jgi:predicted nucleic acid-binding protein